MVNLKFEESLLIELKLTISKKMTRIVEDYLYETIIPIQKFYKPIKLFLSKMNVKIY